MGWGLTHCCAAPEIPKDTSAKLEVATVRSPTSRSGALLPAPHGALLPAPH